MSNSTNHLLTLDTNLVIDMIAPYVIEIRKNKKMFESVMVDIKDMMFNFCDELYDLAVEDCDAEDNGIEDVDEFLDDCNEWDDYRDVYFIQAHFEYFEEHNIGKLWSPAKWGGGVQQVC